MTTANEKTGSKTPRNGSLDIAERIARAIHEQRLEPGAKLKEDEIGAVFGVSRTVVRTALQSLEHSHLVRIEKNRGAFVEKPSIKEAREVFAARALVEPHLAALAASKMTKEDLKLLKKKYAEELATLKNGDSKRALLLSGMFHIQIARLADQATIAGFLETLIGRSSLIIALYRLGEFAVCDTDTHEKLLKAFQEKDSARASKLMAKHIELLVASLDLTERQPAQQSLQEVLTFQSHEA